jgi:phosphorylcholine metabolism protein LicD
MEQSVKNLSPAHLDALDLLGFVHSLCVQHQVPYFLLGEAFLAATGKIQFHEAAPWIELALFPEGIQKLKDQMARQENSAFRWCDTNNTPQFDTASSWVVKRNRVRLPEDRKADEIYYDSKLVLLPITLQGIEYDPDPWRERDKYQGGDEKFRSLSFQPIDLEKLRELTVFAPASLAGVPCQIPQDAQGFWNLFYGRLDMEKTVRKILQYPISQTALKGGEFLRRLQFVQLEILTEFDRICHKHHLRYHIACGTLLGAVRHKGFIPWDDDVDVVMPYEDYLLLDQAMEESLDVKRFFLRTIDSNVDTNITYKQLRRNGTVFMRPGRQKYNFHNGILIDIFPLSIAHRSAAVRFVQTKICRFLKSALWATMGAYEADSRLKRLYYTLISKLGKNLSYKLFF